MVPQSIKRLPTKVVWWLYNHIREEEELTGDFQGDMMKHPQFAEIERILGVIVETCINFDIPVEDYLAYQRIVLSK